MNALRGALLAESGQATVEYSLFTFVLIAGGAFGLLGFLPAALRSYAVYFGGFSLVLGLPFP
jgi:hypothetical protein